jgi:hypothetical protein
MVSDVLWNEYTIGTNQFLRSTSGRFFARVQDDGNFVLYESDDFQAKNAFWSSNSYAKGNAPYSLRMQNDGNLVLYDRNNTPVWASNTWNKGTAPYRLVMENNRNLSIYDKNNMQTWSTATSQAVLDTLGNERILSQNSFLASNNHRFYVRLQDDGNFVLYNGPDFQAKFAVWASNTGGVGQAPFRLVVQNDGNMVIYDRNGTATWSSNTWSQGVAPYRLVMQDDRNLVLYDSNNKATWSSNTYQQLAYDTLECDNHLYQNGFILSRNGRYYARLQDDGNFVCYNSNQFINQNAFWATNTGGIGRGPFKLVPQNDGNLCLYDSTGKCTWSSNTWQKGQAPYRMVMQDDRNLVLYDSRNLAVWASNTQI